MKIKGILILKIFLIGLTVAQDLKDLDKYFNKEIEKELESKKPIDINPKEERQLKDKIKNLISEFVRNSEKKQPKKTEEFSLADKLNLLDDFQQKTEDLKQKQLKSKKDQQDFEKSKRILLESVSNRKLDLSLCNYINNSITRFI